MYVCMYRSSPLVPLANCLTAAACLSSACSFAVSQASDLALLVGNVALDDSNMTKRSKPYEIHILATPSQ